MSTNKNVQTKRSVRWGVVSMLLILSLLLPTAGPVARAQGCEGEDCIQATDMAAADLARLVGYAQVGSSVNSDGTVQFDWTTGYEVGIIGFNLWGEGADGLVQLNEELILASGFGSPEIQSYRYTAATDAEEFTIEHVTFEGETSRSPVFVVGEQMGEDVVQAAATDWDAINAEHDALAAAREAEEIERINRALDVARGPAPSPEDPLIDQTAGTLDDHTVFLPMVVGSADGVQAADADAVDLVPDARIELLVNKDGIYRVTHQDFLDAGLT